MKKLILILALLLLVASNGWAYNETDLLKLKQLNQCIGCDLSGADLSGANLSGANLYSATLSGANLSNANLRGAYLEHARLNGANLRGADFRGSNLRDAIIYGTRIHPNDAKFCKTQMPWGVVNDDCED